MIENDFVSQKFNQLWYTVHPKTSDSRLHDDVIKWKHFPRYWPFVRRIHRSPVNFPHKGQWCGALMFSLICALNKRLSKQSRGWWFETPSCSLWRHCNVRCVLCGYGRVYLYRSVLLRWYHENYIDGLVQDCSVSSALAMEILQSCSKPTM